MYKTDVFIRVRYGETDQMGFVYYGNYASYYEVARVEALRQLGVSYREVEATGVMMPVLENHSRFIAPARYDDLLRIELSIREKPGVRIRFYYRIFNEGGQLLHEGETLLVWMDSRSGKPCRPPDVFTQCLEPYFG